MLLNDIKLKTVCEISSIDNNDMLFKGTISAIKDKYIEIINADGKINNIEEGTLVKLAILNRNNDTYVSSVCLSNDKCLRLTDFKNFKNYEKRKYFRVEVSIETEGYIYSEFRFDSFNPFKLEIVDISLTGLLINTQTELKNGQNLRIILPFKTPETFYCKVVREIEKGYGCEFLDISNKQEGLLSNFIFEEQRKLIQSKKGML